MRATASTTRSRGQEGARQRRRAYREAQVTRSARSIDELPALGPVQGDADHDEPDPAEVA